MVHCTLALLARCGIPSAKHHSPNPSQRHVIVQLNPALTPRILRNLSLCSLFVWLLGKKQAIALFEGNSVSVALPPSVWSLEFKSTELTWNTCHLEKTEPDERILWLRRWAPFSKCLEKAISELFTQVGFHYTQMRLPSLSRVYCVAVSLGFLGIASKHFQNNIP